MKLQKKLSPDAQPSGDAPAKNTVHHLRNIPAAEADLLAVTKAVSASWLINTHITLAWTNQAEFNSKVLAFEALYDQRTGDGSLRHPETQKLINADAAIDNAVEEVKSYIKDKFERHNASAYYNEFGIEHLGSGWVMSHNHDERKKKLEMMLTAIAKYDLGSKKYGTDFWTTIQATFNEAYKNAGDLDQNISGAVGEKNELKKYLNKAMISLRYVLRGNYPDTYQEIYRQWGWKKD